MLSLRQWVMKGNGSWSKPLWKKMSWFTGWKQFGTVVCWHFFLHRLYWHILMLQDSEQVYIRHHKSPMQHFVQVAFLDSDGHRFNKCAPKPVAPITLIVSALRRKCPYSPCLWWNALSVSLFSCLVAFTSNRVKRRETVCCGKHGRAQTQ